MEVPVATYDFLCEDCDLTVAEIRNYETRLDPATCPKCGEPMKYLFPAPVFYFEGGSPTAKAKSQVTSKEAFMEGMDDD